MNEGYHLSPITPADQPAMVKYLNEREIYLRTFYIPFPYTPADAEFWTGHMADLAAKNGGRSTTFAIRKADGEMIGSVGIDGVTLGKSHRGEIGYWLAKPFWGLGLMTSAVADVVKMGFEEFGLTKITSSIFAFNTASRRVLEKNGFVVEGEVKRHYKKDGQLIDGVLFARFP